MREVLTEFLIVLTGCQNARCAKRDHRCRKEDLVQENKDTVPSIAIARDVGTITSGGDRGTR